MRRRQLIAAMASLPLFIPAHRFAASRAANGGSDAGGKFPPIEITRDQWRELLPADRYRILFQSATERAGSSPLAKRDDAGTYVCAACLLPLFSSDDKFDSGTGWPSFTRPIDQAHIGTQLDFKLILPRTEYHCARCGGHHGHVFKDGPPPTGER
jgi:peptide-methionine (R)-S-oxide reductase